MAVSGCRRRGPRQPDQLGAERRAVFRLRGVLARGDENAEGKENRDGQAVGHLQLLSVVNGLHQCPGIGRHCAELKSSVA